MTALHRTAFLTLIFVTFVAQAENFELESTIVMPQESVKIDVLGQTYQVPKNSCSERVYQIYKTEVLDAGFELKDEKAFEEFLTKKCNVAIVNAPEQNQILNEIVDQSQPHYTYTASGDFRSGSTEQQNLTAGMLFEKNIDPLRTLKLGAKYDMTKADGEEARYNAADMNYDYNSKVLDAKKTIVYVRGNVGYDEKVGKKLETINAIGAGYALWGSYEDTCNTLRYELGIGPRYAEFEDGSVQKDAVLLH